MLNKNACRLLAASLLPLLLAVAPVRAVAASPSAGANLASALDIQVPANTFVLSNGLTVVVHEDHSAPLVHVNLWYHVGSKNEPAGKSGFAHLFEHLMFNGSEHFDDDFFKATQKLGATSQNGTTNVDRTNYFQTVPKAALDSILWLESDRMGHLLGAIDQAKLDEQRAVVKNEKRQGDNKPYAMASDLIMRAMMPVGHPYAHSTIGSMEDLDAASLNDVHEWFRTYYGPSNAVLVLSGDITAAEAREKVQKHFGAIAPGTPVSQPTSWVVKRTGTVREVAYDRVAHARMYRAWNVAEGGSVDADHLQLLAQVLAGDRNSRLHRRLVIDEQLAVSVGADLWSRQIGGQFLISVDAKPGVDVARVEAVVDEELARLLRAGPTAAELTRLRTATIASFVRSMESISSKASLLAESQTYLGHPDGWRAGFERYATATAQQVRDAGRKWLADGDYVLHIAPFGNLAASGKDADRSAMPVPDAVVPAVFPAVERATLASGLKLVVARRAGVPLVNMTLLLDTGVAADFAALKPGLGALTMNLLDEGTTTRRGEQLREALANLGATLDASGGGETSQVSLSAMKPTLREALAIYADVVQHPAFADADVDRLKSQAAAGIAAAKQVPDRAAARIQSSLLFGADHPYGRLGTEASVRAMGRDDVAAFHARWFHPNNATLIITGDTHLAEIRLLVEKAFAAWKPRTMPPTIVPAPPADGKSAVYLIDKPGTPQAVIRAALVAPSRKDGDAIAREAMNTVLGGSFTSRLNMKLREEKGWAYGAHSGISGGRGPQVFSASASVQADKTAESMGEIAKLLAGVVDAQPITPGELEVARDYMSLRLTGVWSNSGGVASYLRDQVSDRLPDDHYAAYPGKVGKITLDAVNAEAKKLFAKRPLTWLVVGDRAKIEAAIRALDLGELHIIDGDGRPVP